MKVAHPDSRRRFWLYCTCCSAEVTLNVFDTDAKQVGLALTSFKCPICVIPMIDANVLPSVTRKP